MTTTIADIRPAIYGRNSMVRRARDTAPNSILAGMLTVKEAAAYLGITHHHLHNLRSRGTGPKSFKHKTAVLYRIADLDEWKAAR